jgi:hypothetical protein
VIGGAFALIALARQLRRTFGTQLTEVMAAR